MPTYTTGNPASSEFFLPAGEYQFKVTEAKEDTSKGGNDMIKLKLRLQKKDGSEGPSLYDYLVFTAASFWKVDAFLKAVDQHPGEGKEINVDASALIGLEGLVRVKVEEYDGKKQNKVEAYVFGDGF